MKPRYFNRFLVAAVFTMTAAASAAPVTWNVTDGTWDTVTANWLPASPGTFANGDDATFSQAAGGTVTLVGTIAPLSTTVSAAGGTYTFQGGGITGGTLKVADPVVALPAVGGLVVQLDASQIVAADGSSVTTWTNLVPSGSGGLGDFTTTTGTGAVNPTYVASGVTLNGRPVVRFNNSAMLTNSTVTGTNRTIIYVGRLNGGSNRRLVGGINNNWLMGYWGGEQDVAHLKQSNGFIYPPHG